MFVYYILRAYWHSALHDVGLDNMGVSNLKSMTRDELKQKITEG